MEVLTRAESADAIVEAGQQDAVDVLAESMAARGRHTNLSFFAFTATPKPKTLELFGEQVAGADGIPSCLLYTSRCV